MPLFKSFIPVPMKAFIKCGTDSNWFFIGKDPALNSKPSFANVTYANATNVSLENMLVCSSSCLFLPLYGLIFPWILRMVYLFLKVNPLFLLWWINYPNMLTFFPSSTPTRLQVLPWSSLIIFSSSTACPPLLCVTKMWPLLANYGRSCLLSKEPSSISVQLITLK